MIRFIKNGEFWKLSYNRDKRKSFIYIRKTGKKRSSLDIEELYKIQLSGLKTT
jgi:hypothetical protein